MAAALFGLAGVVIGGLITTGTTYYFSRSASRAEIRKAVRLVADEIDRNLIVLLGIIERGRMPTDPSGFDVFIQDLPHLLRTNAWEAHSAALAQSVDDDAWDELAAFYTFVETCRFWWPRLKAGHEFPPADVGRFHGIVRGGHALVTRLGGTPGTDISELPRGPAS